jgi:hypothetical protein
MAQTAPATPADAVKSKAPSTKPSVAAATAKPGEVAAAPAAAPRKRDPAEAQRQIDAGIKHLQDGKPEPAIQMLSAGIAGGNLPPAMMGRALLHRGMAYRKTNKPAQAISDLTSALWLKGGLGDTDRTEALKQRTEAYREAGLPDQTDAEGRVAGVSARAQRTAAKAEAAASAPATASASQPAATSGVGNFFSSLFGGGRPAAPAPVASAVPAAPSAPQPKAAATSASEPASLPPASSSARKGFGTTTVAAAAPTAAPAPAAPPRAQPVASTAAAGPAKAATALADGKVRARVALVRSRPEAEALVARLRSQYADAIVGRQTDVTEATFGGMGTFFQVRVGPYASLAEAGAACTRLRGTGLDCVPVDR